MVKIIAAHSRTSEKGNFMSLELQGEIEMVHSSKTGRFYATARKCFIGSTFDEQTAKTLVGSAIKGTIVRVESDPYEYTMSETGEVVTMAHRWEYRPEETTTKPVEFINQAQPA